MEINIHGKELCVKLVIYKNISVVLAKIVTSLLALIFRFPHVKVKVNAHN